MAYWFPGWPGPLLNGRQAGVRGVTPPAPPMVYSPEAGPAYASGTPGMAEAMAAYGVPLVQLPTGQIVLQAQTGDDGGIHLPPDLPGMPAMPKPPDGLFTGGPQGGGLFQPLSPVTPFNPGNQVSHLQQQEGRQ